MTVTASCTGGSRLVGGGYSTNDGAGFDVRASFPTINGTWTVTIDDGIDLDAT